jgi:hypothetical protein
MNPSNSNVHQSSKAQIGRTEFVRIVEQTTEGLTESTRAKLLDVAQGTPAVVVGWFHCDGVTCPARQARRSNQRFQEAFDRAMFEHFGREFKEGGRFAFVVEVRDDGLETGTPYGRIAREALDG